MTNEHWSETTPLNELPIPILNILIEALFTYDHENNGNTKNVGRLYKYVQKAIKDQQFEQRQLK